MRTSRFFSRTLMIAAATLSVYAASAQSLATIAQRNYDGHAGPWLTKYISIPSGAPAPEFTVTRWVNRQPTTLHELRNHPVLIYFWATWCAACPAGLAKLQRLARESPVPITIVTIHLSSGAESLFDGREIPTSLPVAVDQGATARDYGVKAVPAYVLIDPGGFVRFVHIRPPTAAEISNADLRAALTRRTAVAHPSLVDATSVP